MENLYTVNELQDGVHRTVQVDERIMEILREKQDVFEAFADDSLTGSEYVKAEKSVTAAIIKAIARSPSAIPQKTGT